MDASAAKKRLRDQLRQREAPGEAAAAAAAERIRDLLLAQSVVMAAARIAMYAALPEEIRSRPLFEALLRSGKYCLFPRTRPDGTLDFARVEAWNELRRSRYGIGEPSSAAEEIPAAGDVVIVPGLAFSHSGIRLGHGAGYYDKTFPAGGSSQPCLIGVAYADRIVESLPHASHDRSMDAIVSEREFRWVRGSE